MRGVLMEENVLEGTSKKRGSAKKYAIAFVVVIVICAMGFLLYANYGGVLPWSGESVNSPDDAADTLSDMGNDISGISDDLKDMENVL